MKHLTVILFMASLCGATVFAQELIKSTGESTMKNKGIISTIINGLAESTRAVHQINQENMTAIRAESRANFQSATATNPGVVRLNETKGLWNKVKVIFENIIESTNVYSERERVRRVEIQSHSSYRTILENQRAGRRSALN